MVLTRHAIVTSRVAAHQGTLPSCQVQWPQALWQQRYNDFCLSREFARPYDQGVVALYGQKPLKISHHRTNFPDHRQCGSEDIMVLACHVMSQVHVVRGSCDFMGSRVSYHPPKFCGHSHSGSGVIMNVVCHVIMQDHMIRESCNFMDGSSSW